MITRKKISLGLIFILITLSFISTIPKTYGAGETIENYIGHDFSEESWSILYDFAGNYLETDYSPPTGTNLTVGASDNLPNIDSKFFFTYSNIRNVHSLYMAFQNFTWDVGNTSAYGCAPYQLLIQHFRPPNNERINIFSINRFLGLLAYRENASTQVEKVPDENDELYMGWAFYSEWHKYIVNQIFGAVGAPAYFNDSLSVQGTATPIPIEETSPDTFKFGMSYQNIFLLWQKISVEEGLDDTVTDVDLLQKCAAFALISEINFTYTISIGPSEISGYSQLTTTTEYDIGELTDLWVLGDDQSFATEFGGANLTLPHGYELSYYNTTNSIKNRLDGNATIPGFSLAVINNANLMIVNLGRPLQGYTYTGSTNFTDQTGNSLGVSTKNISEANYNFEGDPAYKIDFASKPDYILDGSNTYPAPTRVLANHLIGTNVSLMERLYIRALMGTLVAKLTGSLLAGLLTLFNSRIDTAQFYYVTCFPEWSGRSIEQDPTFSVYILDGRIPGFDLFVISLIGLCGALLIAWKVKKRIPN
ncbi:MAG: hypothetical protein GF311_16665 [Candidatus Lokiarchaeota archaeon]|nr:hypothetical protein [Candidatus Lokiarchaeota archaeon]